MHGPFFTNSVVSMTRPILVMFCTLFEWMMLVCRKPCSCFLGLGDRLVDVAAADERHERHHLLDGHERVVLVGLAEEQLGLVGDVACRPPWPARPRPGRGSPCAATSCLCSPSPTWMIALLRQRVDLAGVQPHGAGPLHRRHHLVEDAGDDEHFLLGDAQQVVVVRAAVNDAAGGVVEIGRFIDDDRRIARPGDDRPLAATSAPPEPRPGRR